MPTKLGITAVLNAIETLAVTEAPLAQNENLTRSFAKNGIPGKEITGLDPPGDLTHTLSGGTTKVFDFAALPRAHSNLINHDYTGSKLYALMVTANAANAGDVNIKQNAVNPYPLFDVATGEVELKPSQSILLTFDIDTPTTPAVAAGVKEILFTGIDGDGWTGIIIFKP